MERFICFCSVVLSFMSCREAAPTPPKQKIPVVENGETFELTLYEESAAHPELLFQESDEEDRTDTTWVGPPRTCATGRHQFKPIQLDLETERLQDIELELQKYGEIPCGQWLDAFKSRFPAGDEAGLIGVADPSWQTSTWIMTSCTFPRLLGGGDRGMWDTAFWWCNVYHKGPGWRWLVMVD